MVVQFFDALQLLFCCVPNYTVDTGCFLTLILSGCPWALLTARTLALKEPHRSRCKTFTLFQRPCSGCPWARFHDTHFGCPWARRTLQMALRQLTLCQVVSCMGAPAHIMAVGYPLGGIPTFRRLHKLSRDETPDRSGCPWAPLSCRVMLYLLNPYLHRYSIAFAFSGVPPGPLCLLSYGRSLRFGFPCGRTTGLPRSVLIPM